MRPRRKHRCEKWPARQDRRFTTGSVTGYSISGDTSPSRMQSPGGKRRDPQPIWYVHDAADCYRVIAVFYSYRITDRYDHHLYRRRLGDTAQTAARAYARILNERHLAAIA